MFIYNITSQTDWSIHEQWVEWMKEVHIPNIMQTNCFTKWQFVKVIDIDETDGVTYALQLYAESRSDYNRYLELFDAALRKHVSDKWGNKCIGFRTLMQVVH